MLRLFRAVFLVLVFSNGVLAAPKKEVCIYEGSDGKVRQVNSRDSIPAEFRTRSKCFSQSNNEYLAKPEEIQLTGNVRREDLNSPLGKIHLRWPRRIEGLFGRTPLRATADAAQTVSRALRKGAVPIFLQNLNLNWEIVFLDEEMPETQIPSYLISNCHPGWMTAPANIYIVGQRVAGGCGGPRSSTGVADATLTEVLIHEMGHAVEHALLQQNNPGDRIRAEGFATWFENYASQYSSILNRREIDLKFKDAAKMSFTQNPSFTFRGNLDDYARASMVFRVIEDRRGLQGIFDVYDLVNSRASLAQAIEKKVGWTMQTLDKEIRKFLGLPPR